MALTLDGTNGITGNVSSDTGSPLGLASKQYSDNQPTPRATDVLTADVNDYSLQSAGLVQVDSTDTWCVTGVAYDARVTPMDRSQRWILNASNTRILLNSEDGGSAETNRFTLAEDQVVIPANSAVSLVRDPLDNRWLVTGGELKVGKGYVGGGQFSATVFTNIIERLTYATETTTGMSATLSSSRGEMGSSGVGTSTKGFFAGGYVSGIGNVTTADRLTYGTEVLAVVSGANLSLARYVPAAAGNALKGFCAGGYTNTATNTDVADRITHSTETTVAVTGANLSLARRNLAAIGNVTKGFFAGGFTTTGTTTTDRTTYSTETTAAVSGANLSVARNGLCAVGTFARGYFLYGLTGRGDRTTYSTETTAAVSGMNLSYLLLGSASTGSSSRGFVAGGTAVSSTTPTTRAFRISYATEIVTAIPSANLLTARYYASGVGTGIF